MNIQNKIVEDTFLHNEEERIANLKRYKILRTKSKPIFDQLAAIAATLLNVPAALINFVDKDHIWAKPNPDDQEEPDKSFCSLAVLKNSAGILEEVRQEPFALLNPLMAGEYGLRFYAATPIVGREGLHIGALCIVDKKPRRFSTDDRIKLEGVAGMIHQFTSGK